MCIRDRYTFEELYRLGAERERLWQDYLARLERAGHKRKPQLNVVSVQSS